MANNSRVKLLIILIVVLSVLILSLVFLMNRYTERDAGNNAPDESGAGGSDVGIGGSINNGSVNDGYNNDGEDTSGGETNGGETNGGETNAEEDDANFGADTAKADVLLVNADNPLPEGYNPGELVTLFEKKDRHFQLARADIEVSEIVFTAMDEMFAAAERDGIEDFIITSGYRSSDRQAEIHDEDEGGYAANPWESEHETGLAFDVVAMGNEDFEKTPHFEWLYKHCAEYGFILRYPKGMEDITGFPYEPWHYRYVGAPHAAAIADAGVTLEQYLTVP